MRKLLCFILLTAPAFAGLPISINFELRPSGSDANGGGFIAGATGTDRSQSNTAFCSATDLVLVTATTATSVTCPFSAASVGNLINVTAGTNFTVQRCAVISVATVTATLQCEGANAGTSGATGGSFALGGGLASWAKAVLLLTQTSYCKVYVLTGTYTLTTGLAFGNNVIGAEIEGYNATHGDVGNNFNWTGLLTTATNSVDLFTLGPSSDSPVLVVRNISMSNTAGTRGKGFFVDTSRSVNKLTIDRCKMDGFSYHVDSNTNTTGTAFTNLFILKSELKNATTEGLRIWSNTYLKGNLFTNNAGITVDQIGCCVGASAVIAISNVFQTSGTIAVKIYSGQAGGLEAGCYLEGNVFYSNVADGVNLTGGGQCVFVNNIFDSNGTGGTGYGLNCVNGNGIASATSFNNAYRNNHDGAVNNVGGINCTGSGDVTLSASPFTTPGTDFSLNSTAGGGAALKGVGYLGTIPTGGAGASDIGPLQSAASGGGASNSAYAQ